MVKLTANGHYDDILTKEYLEDQYVIAGKSLAEIEEETGIDATSIFTYLHFYNLPARPRIKPSRGGYVANGYRKIFVNGKKRLAHQIVWESVHGKIPKGMHLHHVNGNRLDNRIENLKLLTCSEHMNIHREQRAKNEEIVVCRKKGMTLNQIKERFGFKADSSIVYRLRIGGYYG
jgi:hypothetical protein